VMMWLSRYSMTYMGICRGEPYCPARPLFYLHALCSFLLPRPPGLTKPLLHLNTGVVREGMEVTAQCLAPNESGSIRFFFYDDGRELWEKRVTTDRAEVKLLLKGAGVHQLHCNYTVSVTHAFIKSQESNRVAVTVKGTDGWFCSVLLSVLIHIKNQSHELNTHQNYITLT